MVKGYSIQDPPPAPAPAFILDENMSNLTCASGDQASGASSGNQNTADHYLVPDHDVEPPNPTKKKRNLPGNPDPDAEVVALSPRSLMATNRFVCEVCNKGFQRDQNLQLHRRGHNLPWKLKQRSGREAVRKKVYVCPELGCVHHDPKRALGDLTGIKKHFCRKHGEKKWKCDKCSKKYAVQSDWKAHSKTCGTREYKCDCGTLFSRRDSFITHRAFCDALAEENARAAINPGPIHDLVSSASHPPPAPPQFTDIHHSFPFKREEISFPSWLVPDTSFGPSGPVPLPMFTGPGPNNANGGPGPGPTFLAYSTPAAPATMSATALLQKAAQMGSSSTIVSGGSGSGSGSDGSKSLSGGPPQTAAMNMMWAQQYQVHVSATATTTAGFGLHLSSRDHQDRNMMMIMGLASSSPSPSSAAFQQDIMLLNSLTGFDHNHNDHGDGSNYEDPFFGSCILDPKKEDGVGVDDEDDDEDDQISGFHRHHHQLMMGGGGAAADDGGIHGGGDRNDGMTRDFLGLTALSHSDIMSIAGFDNCINAPNSPSKQNP